MRCKLHDDVEGTVLGTTTQQIDDVDVFTDHLHHLHFRHQIHHLVVGVALWWHKLYN